MVKYSQNKSSLRVQTSAKTYNNKQMENFGISLFSGNDPDQSPNFMVYKLDHNPYSIFFMKFKQAVFT